MGLISKLASLIRSAPSPRASSRDVGACPTCPETLADADPAFSAAVTALGAKLARADGRSDPIEYKVFTDIFAPEPADEPAVRRLYGLARQTTLGFEAYAKRLADRYRACPNLLERVLDGLFHVARADGAMTAAEMSYLERVSDLFGLSPLSFRRMTAEHLGLSADDPYAVLGVAPDAPESVVRNAWKTALKESHPDRAAGRGLSRDLIEAAGEKAQALNAAFDAVMRERRALGPMAAA